MIFPLMTQLVLPSINGLSALTIGLRLYARHGSNPGLAPL